MEHPISPGQTIRLPITVHGAGRDCELDAVVDTGASFVTIPRRAAAFLGYDLRRAQRVRINTANGVVRAPQVILTKVVLGELEETGVPAVCLDIGAGGVLSLLGMSFLGRFRILLDPRKRLLSITRP